MGSVWVISFIVGAIMSGILVQISHAVRPQGQRGKLIVFGINIVLLVAWNVMCVLLWTLQGNNNFAPFRIVDLLSTFIVTGLPILAGAAGASLLAYTGSGFFSQELSSKDRRTTIGIILVVLSIALHTVLLGAIFAAVALLTGG